ncbi:MAG: hypothetical protein Fur0037_17800 [Planctomycetota bacterium]
MRSHGDSSVTIQRLYSRTRPKQAAPAARDDRRVDTRTVVDRYAPRTAPRTGPSSDASRRTAARPGVSTSPKSGPRDATGAGKLVPRPSLTGRYAPVPRGGSTARPLADGSRTIRGDSRGILSGAIGTRSAPPSAEPRLNPRRGGTTPGSRRFSGSRGHYGGIFRGIYGSYGGYHGWNSAWSYPSIYLSSWFWGDCFWYGFSPSWWWYASWYDDWSWNWASPYRCSSLWWWPSRYYYPAIYSTTYYVDWDDDDYEPIYVSAEPGTAAVAASAAPEPTPLELARKYLGLGDFYFSEGRFAEAAEAYARARTYAPEDPTILFALCDAAFATGDYHFAAYLIGEALRLDPAMASADTDKRLLYKDVSVFEKQMATLRAYIAEKPYDAMAQLVLAYNLKFSDHPTEAIAAFRRVLEIDPESRAARVFLDELTGARARESAPAKDAKKDARKDS